MDPFQILLRLSVIFFGVWILVDCWRLRKEIDSYAKVGMIFGLIVICLDFSIILIIPDFFDHVEIPIAILLFVNLLLFLKIAVFSGLGFFYCEKLEIPQWPVSKRIFGNTKAENKASSIKRLFITTLLITIVFVAYSSALFFITKPAINPMLKLLADWQAAKLGAGYSLTLHGAIIAMQGAVAEELFFRLTLQNFIAAKFNLGGTQYWIPVVISSALWTFSHSGILEPTWVKFIQIFPLGIGLGLLFKRFGIEACILAHVAFNLIMIPLASFLIKF